MVAYTLKGNHAWLAILQLKIEALCRYWADTLPEEEADQKIDLFMEYARCIRQPYVHRSNYYRMIAYIEAQYRD